MSLLSILSSFKTIEINENINFFDILKYLKTTKLSDQEIDYFDVLIFTNRNIEQVLIPSNIRNQIQSVEFKPESKTRIYWENFIFKYQYHHYRNWTTCFNVQLPNNATIWNNAFP